MGRRALEWSRHGGGLDNHAEIAGLELLCGRHDRDNYRYALGINARLKTPTG